jgi:hypothetical protein
MQQQNFFNQSDLLTAEENAYHLIYCDHPYMSELGLSVFTTGQLYNWLVKRNSKGEFVNMQFFDGVNYSPLTPGERIEDRAAVAGKKILGNICPAFYNLEYWFSRWIKQNRTGDYVQTTYVGWSYYDKYDFSDIGFSDYINKNYTLIRNTSGNYIINETSSTHLDDKVSVFVTMNDYARYAPMLDGFYDNALSLKSMATYNFIEDVKNSKEGFIQWSGEIPFRLRAGSNDCVKVECVPFRLYLYDSVISRNQNKAVAFNDIVVSLNKTDVLGRANPKDGTGNLDVINTNNDPKQKVAAPLDITYNPTTGKAESGTPQILVMLEEDLGPATQQTLSDLQTKKIPELLDSKVAHAPTFGKAVPLFNQNGNPLQWAPQYKQKCTTEVSKFTITVYNHSKSTFPKGSIVLANRIDGHWVVQALATDIAEAIDLRPKNWSFTYLMMNFDNFFSNIFANKFTYQIYEDRVWNFYYDKTSTDLLLNNYMPLQVTSWDFMGSNIGGLRPKNALSTTVFNLKPNGDSWEDYEWGAYSAPFFGCVFPDGYNTIIQFEAYNSTHPDFEVYQNSGVVTNSEFIKPIPGNVKLFENNDDNNNPNNNGVGMFFDSNNSTVKSLKHLPADIALNASPSGNFGSPLVDYGYVYDAFTINSNNPPTNQVYRNKITNLLSNNKNVWLHFSENLNASVFDLSPLNPYKIQFRPLKMEIYDAFQPIADPNLNIFSLTARSFIEGGNPPIATGVLRRHNLRSYNGGGMLTFSEEGLEFNYKLERDNLLKGSNEGARFPEPIWSQSWLGSPTKPAGAFGVIGTSCKIPISNSITFNTEYVIGVRSWFGIGARPWYPSLGGQGNNYDSLQNTQLYVRIFHNWPKEQTIYDPAKFAVFHFNPSGSEMDSRIYYYNPTPTTTSYINGLKVWNNIITSNNSFYSILESRDPYRRSKLLPCEYKKLSTIGVSISPTYTGAGTPTSSNFSVVIENQGDGYTQNDTFKVFGGNGVSPVLKANVSNGKIVNFDYLDSNDKGYDYKPEDFLAYDNNFLINKGGLSIEPLSVTGTGFVGRIVVGIGTDSPVLTDSKPKEIGVYQLTPNINTGASDSTSIVNEFVGTNPVTVSIAPDAKSSNGTYDLFFHFHNDCSHTLIETYGAGGPAPLENHVTVTMTPN